MTTVRFGPFRLAIDAARLEGSDAHLDASAGDPCHAGAADFTLSVVPDATCADPQGSFPTDPSRLARPAHDAAGRRFSIGVHPRFFRGPVAAVWQALLYRIFATMCRARGISAGLAHGAAVRRGAHTVLLLGRSGIGKTTAARTAGGAILHDDQLILALHDGAVFVDAPPFRSAVRTAVSGPARVALVCVIARGGPPALRPLGQAAGLAALLRAVVPPFPIDDRASAPEHGEAARFCLAVRAAAPPHELVTDLGGACWSLVDRQLPSRVPTDPWTA